MKYISLFSGIGGFDLGFDRAGMACVAQVERDPSAAGVLAYHWSDVARFDDVRTFGEDSIDGSVDLVCGGFPCQDLSVAGRRAGLAGERSGLWFEFARIVGDLRPQWVVIENVPGLLSSNGGRDFAVILHGLGQFGYLSAWRILDAQYFGVAQRRRRVFIVASLGDGRATQVLFESDSVRGNFAPRREAGQGVANAIRTSLGTGGADDNRTQGGHLIAYGGNNTSGSIDVATACNAHGGSGRMDFESETFVFEPRYARNGRGAPDTIAPPLKAQNGQSGKGDGAPVVAFCHKASASQTMNPSTVAPSLDKSKEPAAMTAAGVRRLVPLECERLQGLPDDWTRYAIINGEIKEQSDSARYRQTGNAVAVPVAEWLGRRIVEMTA